MYVCDLRTTIKYPIIIGGRCTSVHSAAFCYNNSVSLSVRDKSEHCENGERSTCGCYGEPIGSHHRGTPWTHLQHILPPLPQTWGSQPPVKTRIANCGQTAADRTAACTDSLYRCPTQQYHRRPPWAHLTPQG